MTPEEFQEVERLVQQMKTEKDAAKFSELLRKINEILQRKQERLQRSTPD